MSKPPVHAFVHSFVPDVDLSLPTYRHEGFIFLKCDRCPSEVGGRFKIVSSKSFLLIRDYVDVVALAETEHVISCGGSLSFVKAAIDKYVELRQADFGYSGDKPQLFVADADGKGGHYEDLSVFIPAKKVS